MASVILDGNAIVIKCNDGTKISTGVSVDRANLDQLNKTVANAIDKAVLKADDKHMEEIGDLVERASNEAQKIRGQLTAVKPKAQTEKKITRPDTTGKWAGTVLETQKKPDTTSAIKATPSPSEVSMKWIETKLAECERGDIKPLDAIHGNAEAINKYIAPQLTEHQEAATQTVFAALYRILAFRLNLQAQAMTIKEFKLLSSYLNENQGSLARAGSDVMGAANAYMRHYLLYIMADGNAGYIQELSQVGSCKETIGGIKQNPGNLTLLKGPMDSDLVMAAALHIRRRSHEMKNVPQDRIPVWMTPETAAAAVKAREGGPRITEPLDTARMEIRW